MHMEEELIPMPPFWAKQYPKKVIDLAMSILRRQDIHYIVFIESTFFCCPGSMHACS